MPSPIAHVDRWPDLVVRWERFTEGCPSADEIRDFAEDLYLELNRYADDCEREDAAHAEVEARREERAVARRSAVAALRGDQADLFVATGPEGDPC